MSLPLTEGEGTISEICNAMVQKHIPYTSADHLIIPLVREMFARLYNRRQLVRLIGVRFSSLVGGHYQINLFDDRG